MQLANFENFLLLIALKIIFTKHAFSKSLFEKLSTGGKVTQPINQMFFGLICSLEDKFGKKWVLELDKPQP